MSKILESLFFSTWWVIAIFVITFCLYERGIKSIDQDLTLLNKQTEAMITLIADEEETRRNMHERLSSFEDPLWIELLLIKNLGVIPNGYRKYIGK